MTGGRSLGRIRAGIDALDTEVVGLLAKRQELVRQAGAFKTDEDAVRAPDRVEQVIATVRGKATAAGLDPTVAEAVWRAMIEAFIQLELEEHRLRPVQRPGAPGSAIPDNR